MAPPSRPWSPQGRPSRRRIEWQLFAFMVACCAAILQSYARLPVNSLDQILLPGQPKTALLLTAHPDDEAMFFSPTILSLIKDHWQLSGLCLSIGDEMGLGGVRRKELYSSYASLGVQPEDVRILDDPRFQDGMGNHWDPQQIAQELSIYMDKNPISVITFDQVGITQHPNHVPLSSALLSMTDLPPSTRIILLRSPSLYSKFTGPLFALYHASKHFALVPYSRLFGHPAKNNPQGVVIVSSVGDWISGWRAMFHHRSQLVWFRWLYLLFSRLMWVNELEVVNRIAV